MLNYHSTLDPDLAVKKVDQRCPTCQPPKFNMHSKRVGGSPRRRIILFYFLFLVRFCQNLDKNKNKYNVK